MKKEEHKTKSIIKLYCPASSKMAEIIASDDQKLDIGNIARTFGIEPATLKLNGHFISRGIDLIASSVTWRSLLSFFSSKGLSTGFLSSSPLLVDGKLSKPGSKRSHDPTEVTNTVPSTRLIDKSPWQDNIKSPDYKKLKETHNDRENNHRKEMGSDIGLKRKNYWLQNISPFKKSRVGGSYSNNSQDRDQRENTRSNTLANSNLPCGYMVRGNVKRMREDEVLIGVAAPLKRVR